MYTYIWNTILLKTSSAILLPLEYMYHWNTHFSNMIYQINQPNTNEGKISPRKYIQI